MATTSTAQAQSHAVLDFVQSGAYPEDGDVASSTFGSAALSTLRAELTKARKEAESNVRTISRDVAPDVDTWIQRARQLQVDIDQSRTIANDIVKEAEEAQNLQEQRQDASNKADLLRLEVQFNQSLDQNLRLLQAAALSLNGAQQAAGKTELQTALGHLNELDSIMAQLQPLGSSNALDLLRQRSTTLKDSLIEQTHVAWDSVIRVDRTRHELFIRPSLKPRADGNTQDLKGVVRLSSSLDVLDAHVNQLSQELHTGIFAPVFAHPKQSGTDHLVATASHERLSIQNNGNPADSQSVLEVLKTAVTFLHDRLPAEIASPLSERLMPPIVSRLISQELSDATPSSLGESGQFQILRDEVSTFANTLESIGWTGATDLLEWNEQAPKNWLAKRRESSIGIIRNMLAIGLTNTKTVERVETQMVSRGDMMGGADGETDDWGDNWDEDDATNNQSLQKQASKKPQPPADEAEDEDEDDDTSAWDDGAEPEARHEANVAASHANGAGKKHADDAEEDDEEAAWGWDEQNRTSAPPSPVKARKELPKTEGIQAAKSLSKPAEREVTLRETYTVTALPDELYETIFQLTQDAVALRGPKYSSTPIAPAANGLYSVPTLILAGFRALAPSRYELLPGGSMYLYNDSMRLAQRLTELHSSLAASDPAASRLKIDADVEALESFARRAYGKAMASQRTILGDLVDNAQGFAQCTTAPYGSECDSAVAATVGHIRAVAAEWTPILSRSALMQSLGSLLSAVIGKVVVDIEEMGDIGDDESKQLRRYCNELASLSDLFATESPHEAGEKADATGIYTPGWFRFQYLSEILESSLADIRYLWNEGELRLEFDAEEVVELVRALFKDSELRRRAIGEIRRG